MSPRFPLTVVDEEPNYLSMGGLVKLVAMVSPLINNLSEPSMAAREALIKYYLLKSRAESAEEIFKSLPNVGES
jgi:hypothetical protein